MTPDQAAAKIRGRLVALVENDNEADRIAAVAAALVAVQAVASCSPPDLLTPPALDDAAIWRARAEKLAAAIIATEAWAGRDGDQGGAAAHLCGGRFDVFMVATDRQAVWK